MGDLYLPEGEKLSGADNYSEWKEKIERFLAMEDLDKFISSSKVDTTVTGSVCKHWEFKDALARLVIQHNILPKQAAPIATPRLPMKCGLSSTLGSIRSCVDEAQLSYQVAFDQP